MAYDATPSHLGIVADDLTGACDTALQFHSAGSCATVLLDLKATEACKIPDQATLVVHTNSRHLEAYDAVASVKKTANILLKHYDVDRLYKKIDSTFRGHVAQECLALLDELKGKACIVAPAFPEQDRITVGGYQLIGNRPLELTDAARDPLFPVRQSHLPKLLAQQSSEAIVDHIPLSTVVHGAGPIKMAIKQAVNAGKKLIVVDACSDTDLEQIVLAMNSVAGQSPLLPCGSAGLARALAKKWVGNNSNNYDADDDDRPSPTEFKIPQKPILVIMGSLNSKTTQQLRLLQAHSKDYAIQQIIVFAPITAKQLLGEAPINDLAEKIINHLKNGDHVVLSSSFPEDLVEATQQRAVELGLTPQQVNERINLCFAILSQLFVKHADFHLITGGGETASAVCNAMGMTHLSIKYQLETAIALCQDQTGRVVVTKSGGFGQATSLLSIINTLDDLSE